MENSETFGFSSLLGEALLVSFLLFFFLSDEIILTNSISFFFFSTVKILRSSSSVTSEADLLYQLKKIHSIMQCFALKDQR